jgi:hypothetical protein
MKTTNHQSILIVESDEQIREEMVNFLLSASYENAEATESLAHRKIKCSFATAPSGRHPLGCLCQPGGPQPRRRASG